MMCEGSAHSSPHWLRQTRAKPRGGCESAFPEFAANELSRSCVDDKLRNCQFNLADSIILCGEMKSHFG